MKQAVFLPEAEAEFLDALDYYGVQGVELGSDFMVDVEHAAERAEAFPEHGSPYLSGTRRVLLRRFPFSLIYVIEGTGILVVALAHHSRAPGYWRHRVG